MQRGAAVDADRHGYPSPSAGNYSLPASEVLHRPSANERLTGNDPTPGRMTGSSCQGQVCEAVAVSGLVEACRRVIGPEPAPVPVRTVVRINWIKPAKAARTLRLERARRKTRDRCNW